MSNEKQEVDMNIHIHKYSFESDLLNCHNHKIYGYTKNMLGINIFHFHYFYGVCSYLNHTHYYSGITGMPIRTENGHIHKIEGILELNNLHEHEFSDYTFEDIEYISTKFLRRAYI